MNWKLIKRPITFYSSSVKTVMVKRMGLFVVVVDDDDDVVVVVVVDIAASAVGIIIHIYFTTI